MAKEIERKFLVTDERYRDMAVRKYEIRQCYLSDRPEASVRLRVKGGEAFITFKGLTSGAVRDEWEYPIPVNDACEMAERLAGGWSIDKTRLIVEYEGHTWEVDEFHGRHEGLVVAEIELASADTPFAIPPFIGMEVTGDPRYYNSVLSRSGK